MWIHHSGKDEAKGQRGHSSLLGAVDAELEVVKVSEEDSQDRIGQLTITKQKDAEDGIKIGYQMASIQLSPIDPDRTSLAVVPVDPDAEERPRKRRLTPSQQLVMEALTRCIQDGGKVSNLPNIPPRTTTVSVELWRQTYYSMTTSDYEARKKAFQRASTELIRIKMAGTWAGQAWIVEEQQ